MSKRINFQELAAGLANSEAGRGDVIIRSGQCAEADVLALVGAWRAVAALPFGLWEELSAVWIDENAQPADVQLLLRARLFGSGGDLDIWRIDKNFGWRFVGLAGAKIPGQTFAGKDFWEETQGQDVRFFRSETTYLLWGKRQANGLWHEDRIATAKLRYPVNAAYERVQVRTALYSRSGQVEFVWHKGLEEYHG